MDDDNGSDFLRWWQEAGMQEEFEQERSNENKRVTQQDKRGAACGTESNHVRIEGREESALQIDVCGPSERDRRYQTRTEQQRNCVHSDLQPF
jgi:hypothetical protein